MTASKVLVACPNHVVKEYSFQRWIDAVTNLTYPNYDILVVDNSPGGELAERYGAQVPIVVLDASDRPEIAIDEGWSRPTIVRINRSMELIRQHFLTGGYSHWMNIESDVIPPPDVIEVLLESGRGGDLISHTYTDRKGGHVWIENGIGCSLFSRPLIEAVGWQDAGRLYPDSWLWSRVMAQARTYRTVKLWGYLDEIDHVEDPLAEKTAATLDFARRAQDAERKAAAPRFARRARQFAGRKAERLFVRLAKRARQFSRGAGEEARAPGMNLLRRG